MNLSPCARVLAIAPLVATPALAAENLSPEAAERLGLDRAERIELHLAGVPGEATLADVEIAGQRHWIELAPNSLRAAGFQLIEQRDGDRYVTVEADAPLTYRGAIPTLPGVQVAASWLEGGLHARLLNEDGSSLWIEPLLGRLEGATSVDYVLYHDNDVRDTGASCGLDAEVRAQSPIFDPSAVGGGEVMKGGTLKIAELGIDADFEYFQDYGSSNATQNQIESVINTMNLQYENDVAITHEITTIIIRTSPSDPYSTSDPIGLLNQFVNHWNSSQGGIQRDVAHLFTGKNLSGSVIGIAYLNAICSSFGYGLVESDCCGSFASKTDLSAHELGHNWSADHCSCTGFTMNSFLTSANKFSPSQTIPQVINYSNSLGCIDTGPGGPGGGECANTPYGVGAATANIGTLSSTDDAQLGTTWTADFSGFPGNTAGLFIAAGTQASIPFGQGLILIPYQSATATVNVSTNSSGNGTVNVPVPNNPGLAGNSAFVQVGVLDGSFVGGYAFTNGLQVTFCN
ncbi:MAG: M12 family metallo-peptidase [Planctomycetota bacterium]|jgi:hypothetical protein